MKILILVSLFPMLLLAQTDCHKYERNPVLYVGIEGRWDGKAVFFPNVIFDGAIFKMWYSGFDGVNYRIGYATSPDGKIWTKADEVNPVLDIGEDGRWDDERVTAPCVLLEDGVYQMWYSGHDGIDCRIGYATSFDGITWLKHENPILEKEGVEGDWEYKDVIRPKVIKYQNEYIMFYGGHNGSAGVDMGFARSPNGITWTKEDRYNPVLTKTFSWEAAQVSAGAILVNNEKFNMWYYGGNRGYKIRTGYAVSTDGISWEKHNTYVLNYGHYNDWDYKFASIASVHFDGETYHFWYDSYNYNKEIGAIGYATSPHVVGVEEEVGIPVEYSLSQNYPNPFNPSTTIKYTIPNIGNENFRSVQLKIYDVLGGEVVTLVNKSQKAGYYEVNWNAVNNSSGIYFYRIQACEFVETKKMVLLR